MDERERVLSLLRTFGWNATSFQVLEPGLRYWFEGAGCVAGGEQPWWDPQRWTAELERNSNLREQLRRARAKGSRPSPTAARRA